MATESTHSDEDESDNDDMDMERGTDNKKVTGIFPSGGLEGLRKRMNNADILFGLRRSKLAYMIMGSDQPQLTTEQEELLVAEVLLEERHESSYEMGRFGCPYPERYGQYKEIRNPEHAAWRNRVVDAWRTSSSENQGCRYSNSFHSKGTPPCNPGWGKILHEHALTHGQHSMETDTMENVLEEYRRKHAGDERFKSPVLRPEPGVNPEITTWELQPPQ